MLTRDNILTHKLDQSSATMSSSSTFHPSPQPKTLGGF